jgi:hypothetical protein
VVSRCANPGCSATFHYLRDGKVFQLQVYGSRSQGPTLVRATKPPIQVEHFWLCGPCASSLTLQVDNGKVITVPLDHPQFRRAAAS